MLFRSCRTAAPAPVLAAIAAEVVRSGAELVELEVRRATLEDVFLELTREPGTLAEGAA